MMMMIIIVSKEKQTNFANKSLSRYFHSNYIDSQ